MAKGWVAQIVGQAGGINNVRIATQSFSQFAAHLRYLKTVREAGAHKIISCQADNLSLGTQAAQRRGVHDPRPITLERGALGAFRFFCAPALKVRFTIAVVHAYDCSAHQRHYGGDYRAATERILCGSWATT